MHIETLEETRKIIEEKCPKYLDKFDDLKVKTRDGMTEFQIKYSDDKSAHQLTKDDFANGNGHDTALCDLFASWKTRNKSENNILFSLFS